MRSNAILPALLMLSGCGLADVPASRDLPSPGSEYQRIVAQSSEVVGLRAKPEFSYFEISSLRPAVAPQPGEWMTCLRTTETIKGVPRLVHFGVFLRRWVVVDMRRGIGIDRCEQEQYAVLGRFPVAKSDGSEDEDAAKNR